MTETLKKQYDVPCGSDLAGYQMIDHHCY